MTTTTISTDSSSPLPSSDSSDEYVPTTIAKNESLFTKKKKTKGTRSVRKPAAIYATPSSPLREEKKKEFEIDNILAHRMDPKTSEMQYRVKWKGFNHRYNKWIRSCDLNCDDAILKYHDSMRRRTLEEALTEALAREREYNAKGI